MLVGGDVVLWRMRLEYVRLWVGFVCVCVGKECSACACALRVRVHCANTRLEERRKKEGMHFKDCDNYHCFEVGVGNLLEGRR